MIQYSKLYPLGVFCIIVWESKQAWSRTKTWWILLVIVLLLFCRIIHQIGLVFVSFQLIHLYLIILLFLLSTLLLFYFFLLISITAVFVIKNCFICNTVSPSPTSIYVYQYFALLTGFQTFASHTILPTHIYFGGLYYFININSCNTYTSKLYWNI